MNSFYKMWPDSAPTRRSFRALQCLHDRHADFHGGQHDMEGYDIS